MLLQCQVIIMNRLAPGHDTRQCHCTLILGKKRHTKKNGDEVFFTLHTMRNKSGTKYLILKNIIKVHNRFVDDGKCTLSMTEPAHDLVISKANASGLKKFLHIVRLVLKGQQETIVNELSTFTEVKNTDLEKPKTSMMINSRKDYPLKNSFPVTLETLNINGCALKIFDSRILKLHNLKILDLSHNSLSALCESLENLENLRCLNLSHNNLQAFPACILKRNTAPRLKTLDLSRNNLAYVPAGVSALRNLSLFKLCKNKIQALPSSIGYLKSLQRFECSENLLNYLPWSFSNLQLDFIDLSQNLFCDTEPGILEKDEEKVDDLLRVPSLFELTGRYVVKTSMQNKLADHLIPRPISQCFESVTYCPCGEPCLTHGLPFVKLFDICKISSSVSYGQIEHGKAFANIVTRLCSKTCYQNYLHNPKGSMRKKKRQDLS